VKFASTKARSIAAASRRAAPNDGWLGVRYTEEQIPSMLKRIREARKEQGTLNKPFEVWLAPMMSGPETYKRLEEMGVTMVSGAHVFVDGKVVPTTLDFKKRRMEAFATQFLKQKENVFPMPILENPPSSAPSTRRRSRSRRRSCAAAGTCRRSSKPCWVAT
jgi:hypothetical protein